MKKKNRYLRGWFLGRKKSFPSVATITVHTERIGRHARRPRRRRSGWPILTALGRPRRRARAPASVSRAWRHVPASAAAAVGPGGGRGGGGTLVYTRRAQRGRLSAATVRRRRRRLAAVRVCERVAPLYRMIAFPNRRFFSIFYKEKKKSPPNPFRFFFILLCSFRFRTRTREKKKIIIIKTHFVNKTCVLYTLTTIIIIFYTTQL